MEHPMNLTYLGIPGWLILSALWVTGGFFFCKQTSHAVKLISLGKAENRRESMKERFFEVIKVWLGQKKVLEDRVIGIMHVMIFWGFLMIGSDVFDLSTGGRFEAVLIWMSPIIADLWNGMVELGYVSAMLGASAALFRRVVIRPEKLRHESQFEGNAILVTILTICVTAFIVEAGENPSSVWEPIGYMVSGWIADFSFHNILVIYSYWLHMACLAGFLIAIPASKHMHLVMAFPNVLFHDREGMAVMKPMATTEDGKAVLIEELDI